jgi:hypothetical protein
VIGFADEQEQIALIRPIQMAEPDRDKRWGQFLHSSPNSVNEAGAFAPRHVHEALAT